MINSHALLPTELWRINAKRLPYLTGGNPQLHQAYYEMMQIISDTKPNTEVIITISRLGKVIDLPVIIEEFPSN